MRNFGSRQADERGDEGAAQCVDRQRFPNDRQGTIRHVAYRTNRSENRADRQELTYRLLKNWTVADANKRAL